jgi:formate dehydrogenase subunit delta
VADKLQKLVRMANQIEDFFRPYPDDKAIAGIQEHLRNFWTPRMREELAAYAAAGGKGIDPRVLEAIRRSVAAESPVEKVTAGPNEVGQLASDAG